MLEPLCALAGPSGAAKCPVAGCGAIIARVVRKRYEPQRSLGRTRCREGSYDVPPAKRICGAAVGTAAVVPSGENVRVSPPLAALGRGEDDREAYVGVEYRDINDKVVLVDTLLADPTLEDLSEGQIVVLETLVQFVHTRVLKRDSAPAAKTVDGLPGLVEAAAQDRGPLHRMLHALATGDRFVLGRRSVRSEGATRGGRRVTRARRARRAYIAGGSRRRSSAGTSRAAVVLSSWSSSLVPSVAPRARRSFAPPARRRGARAPRAGA